MLSQALGRKGIECTLFDQAHEVPQGSVAFVRLDQQRDQREISKRMIWSLNQKGVKTVPSLRESIWYDDKKAQYNDLKPWMPETKILNDLGDVTELFGYTNWKTPFISKCSEGTSSKGVRLIQNTEDAVREAILCFSDEGMSSGVYDRVQKGYVYWQELMPNNKGDYRITRAGNLYWGVFRSNQPGTPFASGTKEKQPVYPDGSDDRALKAFDLAQNLCSKLNIDFVAFDIVFDENDEPKVLEMSSTWMPHWMPAVKAYEIAPYGWEYYGHTSGHMFDQLANIVIEKEQG